MQPACVIVWLYEKMHSGQLSVSQALTVCAQQLADRLTVRHMSLSPTPSLCDIDNYAAVNADISVYEACVKTVCYATLVQFPFD